MEGMRHSDSRIRALKSTFLSAILHVFRVRLTICMDRQFTGMARPARCFLYGERTNRCELGGLIFRRERFLSSLRELSSDQLSLH